MAFDNQYQKRKDWRKPYQKRCEIIDRDCRPGGSCPWCQANRKFRRNKKATILDSLNGENHAAP